MKRWPLAALLGMAVGAGVFGAWAPGPALQRTTFAVSGGAGGAAVAVAAGTWVERRRSPSPQPIDVSLATAMPEWEAGRRSALEAMVAQFAGPEPMAHALRCAALADSIAEQLVLKPEETADLVLAGVLHVLPTAFPRDEDAHGARCQFGIEAMTTASALLERVAPPGAAAIAGEVRERWDGTGYPRHFVGEATSLGGRILAAVCAFDHASAGGLEAGIAAVIEGSGTAFDPVVVGEITYLFREPWQAPTAA